MWIIEGIIAGIVAGVFMGVAAEIIYRIGILRSNLVIIDGSFALRLFNRKESHVGVYVLGTFIHLVTSMVFGVVYVVLARFLGFATQLTQAIVVYVVLLWIAMLLVALPIAGQGIMGNKIGRFVWVEQLILHIVFGLGFWWALGLI